MEYIFHKERLVNAERLPPIGKQEVAEDAHEAGRVREGMAP